MSKQITYTISWSQPYGKTIDVRFLQAVLAKNTKKLQELQETLFEKELEKSDFAEAKTVLDQFRVNK